MNYGNDIPNRLISNPTLSSGDISSEDTDSMTTSSSIDSDISRVTNNLVRPGKDNFPVISISTSETDFNNHCYNDIGFAGLNHISIGLSGKRPVGIEVTADDNIAASEIDFAVANQQCRNSVGFDYSDNRYNEYKNRANPRTWRRYFSLNNTYRRRQLDKRPLVLR